MPDFCYFRFSSIPVMHAARAHSFKKQARRLLHPVSRNDAEQFLNVDRHMHGLNLGESKLSTFAPKKELANRVRVGRPCGGIPNCRGKEFDEMPLSTLPCRAGTTTRFYWGNREEEADAYCWHSDNSGGTTHPVGQKKDNAWGLKDMSGLVLQWVEEWYDKELAGGTDPLGPSSASGHVSRGGSWYYSVGSYCRSAHRGRGEPGGRYDNLGFRLAIGQ